MSLLTNSVFYYYAPPETEKIHGALQCRSIGQYYGLSHRQSHIDAWIGLFTVIPYHTYTGCFYNGGLSTKSPQALRRLLTAFHYGVKGVSNGKYLTPNAIDGTRTRTHFLSISSGLPASLRYHALAELPGSRTINSFRCFWNPRLRPASVLLRSILLSYNGIFKIGGNETNKQPPISLYFLFVFAISAMFDSFVGLFRL